MSIEKSDFYKIATERQELRGDLLDRSGKAWHEQKKTWKKEEAFSGVAEAIESGNILQFLSQERKEEEVSDPDVHIKNRLAELDKQAGSFSLKNKEQLADVRKDRGEEKKQSESFEKISREIYALEKIEEANLRAEFNMARRSRGKFSDVDKNQLMEISKIQTMIEKRRAALKENPKTYQFFRMHELKQASSELAEFGFASMESQREDMDWIRKRWSEGSAVLLEGPTGTGKTELLNYMARKLYRTTPELLRCTERTGPPEIFGKTMLKSSGKISKEKIHELNEEIETRLNEWLQNNPDADEKGYHAANERFLRLATMGFEGTETFFQPGRYTTAIDRGVPLLMDEFNQLPTNMRFAFKELYNRKPGDEIRVQEDSGVTHTIKEGFAWAATANIKSGKHKERFDLDGAESRVFEMLHIGYMPKDELYDLSLASLMDKKNGVHLSGREASVVLRLLVEAAEEIQKGYAEELGNHYGMSTGRGEKPSLEKAVLDPGKVLRVAAGYKMEALKGVSFQDYLDERLKDFVSKGDYPEKDRELMIRILVSKGFFQDIPAKEFSLKELTEPILNSLRGAKMERTEMDGEKYLTLEQLSALDPFGKRAELFSNLGSEFLEDEEKEKLLAEIEKIRQKIAQSGKVADDFFEQPVRPALRALWKNPETDVESQIEIDFEKQLDKYRRFYKDNLGLNINESEIKEIWRQNYAEIKKEMEKYGYDAIIIVPDNLPEEEILNKKLIESMPNTDGTYQGDNFKQGGSFAGVKNSYAPECRIVLTHAVQNIADHPILKATRNKNLMNITGIGEKMVLNKISSGGELLVNCEVEISGKKFAIQAEGISLEDYLIQQRVSFDENKKHLDEKSNSYTWLLKSRSGSQVVNAVWDPADRQLVVTADASGAADDYLGLRLSRSFKKLA